MVETHYMPRITTTALVSGCALSSMTRDTVAALRSAVSALQLLQDDTEQTMNGMDREIGELTKQSEQTQIHVKQLFAMFNRMTRRER